MFFKVIDGSLEEKDLIWDRGSCLTVVLTSKGYPNVYEKGYEITGLESLDESIMVFHNGTKYNDNILVNNGGRVLSITSLGEDILKARVYIKT